jgi:hypothetical protein
MPYRLADRMVRTCLKIVQNLGAICQTIMPRIAGDSFFRHSVCGNGNPCSGKMDLHAEDGISNFRRMDRIFELCSNFTWINGFVYSNCKGQSSSKLIVIARVFYTVLIALLLLLILLLRVVDTQRDETHTNNNNNNNNNFFFVNVLSQQPRGQ